MQAYIAFVEGGLHACTHKHGEGERDQTGPTPPIHPIPPPPGKSVLLRHRRRFFWKLTVTTSGKARYPPSS